jgi:hypothetical protein
MAVRSPSRGQALMDGGVPLLDTVVTHPAQRAAAQQIGALITRLRSCKTTADVVDFQKLLFQHVHAAQEEFHEASRQAKRAEAGRSTASAPPAGDWATERRVWDRIQRQYRAVGDALAWRMFGFDRRYIIALSRNADPGLMARKTGLPYELGHVTDLWERRGVFGLLHDVTNCLRIADITEFHEQGPLLREIKKNRSQPSSAQLARMQQVLAVINDGAPLAGGTDGELSMFKSTVQSKTAMKRLGDALDAAYRVHTCSVAVGRGWVIQAASGVLGAPSDTGDQDLLALAAAEKSEAFRRSGLYQSLHQLHGRAFGDLAVDAAMAPPTIFPLAPHFCAYLTCDLMVFQSFISYERLRDAFQSAGFEVTNLLPSRSDMIDPAAPVLQARIGNRGLTLHASAFAQVLMELIEPERFALAVKEICLSPSGRQGPGVFTFANERAIWR